LDTAKLTGLVFATAKLLCNHVHVSRGLYHICHTISAITNYYTLSYSLL